MPLTLPGKQALLDARIDLNTDTINANLVRLTTADTHVKAVTGATNATPIVLTITAHGWANGDIILVAGVGGNLAANGIWKVANQATNTVELTNPVSGSNVVGSGAYTSGGFAVNLTQLDFMNDIDGCIVGSAVVLGSPTITNGVFDTADPTFTSVAAGAAIQGVVLSKGRGGASSADEVIFLDIGMHIITVNTAASSSATTLLVEPLEKAVNDNDVLTFSDGTSATVNGDAAAGARSITVDALAANVAAGARALALADVTNNFPITPNGGNIGITVDPTAGRGWFAIVMNGGGG